MNKKNLKKEIKQVAKWLGQESEKELLASAIGERFGQILHGKWDSTECWAIALSKAIITAENDLGSRRGCRSLLIQWMMEHYAGFLLSEAWPFILDVYNHLVHLQYTKHEPLEFNDIDNRAWYEKSGEEQKIFVLESQSRRLVVMVHGETEIHVRRAWYKWDEGKNQPYDRLTTIRSFKKNGWRDTHGDGRDAGYVLSRDRFNYKKKIEHADHSWTLIELFLFEIRCTYGALQEVQTSRLSEIHNRGC